MTTPISPVIDSWLEATEEVAIEPTTPVDQLGPQLRRLIDPRNFISWLDDPFVKAAIDRYARQAHQTDAAMPNIDELVCLVWTEAANVHHADEVATHHDLMVECWAIEVESLTADDFDV